VRLLSNLETGRDKLLQIVLFGQPELDQTLANHDIRQLKERITYSFMLTPFHGWEIRDYLHCRLRASGYRGGELFTPKAVRVMERYSQGLVRRINILADKALLAAYAQQAMTVTPKHVLVAARDSEFAPNNALPPWSPLAAAAVLVITVAGALLWLTASAPPTASAGGTVPASNSPSAFAPETNTEKDNLQAVADKPGTADNALSGAKSITSPASSSTAADSNRGEGSAAAQDSSETPNPGGVANTSGTSVPGGR